MTHVTSHPGGDVPSYSYRPSAVGAPRTFRLSGQFLDWDTGRRSGRIALGRIIKVRMSYRPATMQNLRFVTEIWSLDGPRLIIVSTSWKSMAEQVRLDDGYRAFVMELHTRLAAAGSSAQFVSGVHPLMFGAGVLLFVGAGIGLVGLILRAIQANILFGALLIGVFLALFVWQTRNFLLRNRPGCYEPRALPTNLLPRGQD
jgi:hypothetical protein